MTQGVHALTTSEVGCLIGATGFWAWPPVASCPLRETEVQIWAGFQNFRKVTSATIEQMAAITSTSSGPMSLDSRNCGMGKLRPVTSKAGQICFMPFQPAKAQISQNGTSSEKKGNWRPIMADTAARS